MGKRASAGRRPRAVGQSTRRRVRLLASPPTAASVPKPPGTAETSGGAPRATHTTADADTCWTVGRRTVVCAGFATADVGATDAGRPRSPQSGTARLVNGSPARAAHGHTHHHSASDAAVQLPSHPERAGAHHLRRVRRPPGLCTDEQMIQFTGLCPTKQYVPNEPHPVGLKNFVAARPDGLVLHSAVYQGGNSFHPLPPELKLGVGGTVTAHLAESFPVGTRIYCDRYFTSVALIDYMLSKSMYVTGMIMN